MMKDVTFEWVQKQSSAEDSILLIRSTELCLEIAQLKHVNPKTARRRFCAFKGNPEKPWKFRAVHFDTDVMSSHFGEKWEDETWNGFETVAEFRSWLSRRKYREENVVTHENEEKAVPKK